MNNKGLSTVVTNIILILFVFAVIVSVWYVVHEPLDRENNHTIYSDVCESFNKSYIDTQFNKNSCYDLDGDIIIQEYQIIQKGDKHYLKPLIQKCVKDERGEGK